MGDFSFDLGGRTVLVTGASSGLGARFARVLAGSGARVAIAARRADRLDALAAEIGASGGQVVAVAMDVADEASTIAAFDAVEQAFGPVDSVIANAGMNLEGAVLDLDVADFDAIMAVNVRGVFLTVREAARRMIAAGAPERRHGRIVTMSSITAASVSPGVAVYSASKAAIQQLSRVLARDWANKGVNINSLCPGYIETELNTDWFQTDLGKRQISRWPRRALMPEDSLDAMMLYLASDASAHVTGSSFVIDDGQSM
ncbi:MAG TPA: SDR family NAD(P)-dependent oxidoreductase [Caulobacteraceae bacterium]|jgi:NAD(P)-dependent dehydrogenase (short-subunit alcohol dehydrogenase family)|nr:SDR family NAD(P)-dependent oxidoreductase [Caulobacteraceae bacterium]